MLKPLNDRVLLKRLPLPNQTASGLVTPDTADDRPVYGEVRAVGPDVTLVGVGDVVLIGKYAGINIDLGNETVLVKQAELLAKVPESARWEIHVIEPDKTLSKILLDVRALPGALVTVSDDGAGIVCSLDDAGNEAVEFARKAISEHEFVGVVARRTTDFAVEQVEVYKVPTLRLLKQAGELACIGVRTDAGFGHHQYAPVIVKPAPDGDA